MSAMDSITELPELTSLVNINSDFLNKGQLNLAYSKPFHTDLIDNQIHHMLSTDTQYTSGDSNNNTQLLPLSSSSEESDPDDSELNDLESTILDSMNDRSVRDLSAKPKRKLLRSGQIDKAGPSKNQLEEIRSQIKTLRKKYPSEKSKAIAAKFRPSRRLFKSEDVRRDLQNELVSVLAAKKPKFEQAEQTSLRELTQRRKSSGQNISPGGGTSSDPSRICDTSRKGPPLSNLLDYRDMPPHLQFNPYITSGYRPILDAWGCLKSLCYVHNETVNIFTHGLPIIYILLTVPHTMPWHLEDTRSQFLIWSHLAGATCPWMGSILYHLFMNCGSSPLLYRRLLQIDMFGIWISQSFGALPMLFASVHCLSNKVRFLVIVSYCIFSIWGLHKALIAATPWSRRICFALPFMMRNLLCILRLTKYGGGAPDSLVPTILQDVACVVGGVIGAEKVPEKWWPGATDFAFNSHNLMHVLALLALYYNNRGSVRDIVWMRSDKACS